MTGIAYNLLLKRVLKEVIRNLRKSGKNFSAIRILSTLIKLIAEEVLPLEELIQQQEPIETALLQGVILK